MAENVVIKDTCDKIHKAVDEKFERDTERLNEHSGRIRTIEDAIVRLTIMTEKYEKGDDGTEKKKDSFWNTKTGQAIPICITIVVLVIIAALVGTNLIEGWQQVKDYIPKG
jgi:hypothetical protein